MKEEIMFHKHLRKVILYFNVGILGSTWITKLLLFFYMAAGNSEMLQ